MAPSTSGAEPGNAASFHNEQMVLGAILTDNSVLWRIGALEVDDFTDVGHRLIFEQAVNDIHGGQICDPFTLFERFSERQIDAEHTDLGYLSALVRELGSLANAHRYANRIRAYARRTRAMHVLRNALALAPTEPAIIPNTIRELQQIASGDRPVKSFADVMAEADAARRERERRRAAGGIDGVSTTLPRLDDALGGLAGPRLCVLGGRPGRFKSVFAWQIALNGAMAGKPIGFISLEMAADELGERAYMRGPVESHWPVWVDDHAKTLHEIVGRIVELRHMHRIELAVIDHLQLIKTRAARRFDELAEISRTLKTLAMELRIPILALSQISREVERERREPRLSDLRECGNIEQDADVVMFIHATESVEGAGPGADTHELLIAKNRGGPARTWPIKLNCNGRRATVTQA